MSEKPLILVTNDDGFDADGLWVLVEAVAPLGRVAVVAPQRQQSWTGRSHRSDPPDPAFPSARGPVPHPNSVELRAREWRVPVPDPVGCWTVAATPARTVATAWQVLGLRPDLLVSGVNDDWNVAQSLTESGTVGAALQGADLGVPSVAFSDAPVLASPREFLIRSAREIAAEVLERGLPDGCGVLNVNFPDPAAVSGVPGWQVTRTAYPSAFRRVARPDGLRWELAHVLDTAGLLLEPGTDLHAVVSGDISLTFVPRDMGMDPGPGWARP